MRTMKRKLSLVFYLLMPAIASATLGGNEGPVAVAKTKTFTNFRRLEDSTGKLAQFTATSTGKVFAVFWKGRNADTIMPALGEYATDLQTYEQQHPHRAGRIPYRKVNAGRVIFEFWDLPKMVKGRAYVPRLMPPGLTADDIN